MLHEPRPSPHLDAFQNPNLVAVLEERPPGPDGTLVLEVPNDGGDLSFGHLGALELVERRPRFHLPGAPVPEPLWSGLLPPLSPARVDPW